jgi:predicted dehydrogenase
MDISGGVDDVVFSLAGAMDTKPDAALVTCPASQHVATSLALARMDVHLFIEKPLSTSLEGVDDLLEVCAKRRLVLMIGYNLRFSPSLKILRKALIDGRIGRPLSIRAEV